MTSGLFAILDDILILMDDALMLTKTATKKTAGILADDLAINADKASGFKPSRELPVLWKISKGSFINKLIILPAVFLLSTYLPFLIIPILLCGGVYLSFEGALNVYKMLFNKKEKSSTSELHEKEAEDAQIFEQKMSPKDAKSSQQFIKCKQMDDSKKISKPTCQNYLFPFLSLSIFLGSFLDALGLKCLESC